MNMDIRQSRYFLTIAQEGQITRRKQLNMERPPLSRQLKLMEEELGVLLFEREATSAHPRRRAASEQSRVPAEPVQ